MTTVKTVVEIKNWYICNKKLICGDRLFSAGYIFTQLPIIAYRNDLVLVKRTPTENVYYKLLDDNMDSYFKQPERKGKQLEYLTEFSA
jgi:hypothetical protein